MKVKELIEILSKLDPEIPVCTSDENSVSSNTDMVTVYNGPHYVQYNGPKLIYRMDKVEGPFVLIGELGDFVSHDYSDSEIPLE